MKSTIWPDPASPMQYQLDPIQTTKTSVYGAVIVLERERLHSSRVFQASTSEVYGDPFVHPQPESYFGNVNPIGPRACHDEGKRCAETLFFEYHRRHGVAIRVARIFNTFRPRMHPNDRWVVSNFIVRALKGDDITIFGDKVPALGRKQRKPDNTMARMKLGWEPQVSLKDGLARTIAYFERALVVSVA